MIETIEIALSYALIFSAAIFIIYKFYEENIKEMNSKLDTRILQYTQPEEPENSVNNDKYLMSTSVRVKNSTDFMDYVDRLIEIEILNVLKKTISLNEHYQMNTLDIDAQTVATNVFNMIDKEAFHKGNDTLLTSEGMMRYITTNSIRVLLDVTQKWNASH